MAEVHPKRGDLNDETLRYSGQRDASGDQRIGNQEWPANPRTDIIEPQVAGRSNVEMNDWMLHMQEPPERIDRMNNQRIFGAVSPAGQGGHNPRRAGEYMIVGHVPAMRTEMPKNAPAGNPTQTIDDHSFIPASKIGNPL